MSCYELVSNAIVLVRSLTLKHNLKPSESACVRALSLTRLGLDGAPPVMTMHQQ
jgi:hypothetical protein